MVRFRNMRTDGVWFYAEVWDKDAYDEETWVQIKAKIDGSYHSHSGSWETINIVKATWSIIRRYVNKGKKLPERKSISWG